MNKNYLVEVHQINGIHIEEGRAEETLRNAKDEDRWNEAQTYAIIYTLILNVKKW